MLPDPHAQRFGPYSGFPPAEDYARAFLQEAVRHLGDARVLHTAQRWAGAVTSAMKAAELALKGGLMLEGALGWWGRLEQTHAPFKSIAQHPVLRDHAGRLEAANPTLRSGLEALEGLVSNRSGEGLSFENLVNPEYPFYFVGHHPLTRVFGKYLLCPGGHFGEPDSRLHYATARDVLLAYQQIEPLIASWDLQVPPAL